MPLIALLCHILLSLYPLQLRLQILQPHSGPASRASVVKFLNRGPQLRVQRGAILKGGGVCCISRDEIPGGATPRVQLLPLFGLAGHEAVVGLGKLLRYLPVPLLGQLP